MSRLKTFAAVVLAATVPAMAQAADFNLTGGSGTTSTATFSSGGIGLNVTAWTDDGQESVTFSSGGLGVSTGFFDAPGVGNNESLRLTFSQAVNLTSLRLAEWDIPDNVTLSWAGGSRNLVGDGIVSTDGTLGLCIFYSPMGERLNWVANFAQGDSTILATSPFDQDALRQQRCLQSMKPF